MTTRQLRTALRTAQNHNLNPKSDLDAVRLLREKGIDPFERSGNLLLVQKGSDGKKPVAKINPIQLPQKVKSGGNLPATDVMEAEDPAIRRAREVQKIQEDIIRRRRRRLALLMVRLAFFVGLPTLICGYYFYNIATPMYSTKASFIIQKNEAGGSPSSGAAGLLGSTQLATVQDSSAVQQYLTSESAMLRLDEEIGFKEHFQSTQIDSLKRLPLDASNRQAYKRYKKQILVGYDPTEGIVNMEVVTASPAVSAAFAERLMEYAEEQVSNLTQRIREDQMAGARASYQEAENARKQALTELSRLQAELEVVDSATAVQSLQSQIQAYEKELSDYRLQLAEQLANRRPSQVRVDSLNRAIDLRQQLIAQLNSELTSTNSGELSATEKQARLRVAEADFATRDALLQSALEALEAARISADRQARYLAQAVAPVSSDEPTYPRKFENTLVSLLIFLGAYLMLSLTVSVLREQV